MSDRSNGQGDQHANCGSVVRPSRFTTEGWGVCASCEKPRRLNVEADPGEEATQKNCTPRTGGLRTFADVGR